MKEEYFQFLRFPSISADPAHKKDVRDCCNWVARFLKEGGLHVEVWETSGHPTVFAQTPHKPGCPVVLLYGHYDVQPVDPIDEWLSDPFEPEERDGEIYARGAQDNKGQIFYTMVAVKQLLDLPLNIKLCIEGEEESGSTGLSGILTSKQEALQADAILVVDVEIPSMERPAITLGARGMVAMTIECIGSNRDLHSGFHGGIAYNPNHALIEILAQLRDGSGQIQIPGFYDGIEPVATEGLDLDFDEEEYQREFAAKPNGGEVAFSPGESATIRPTLEINGISGGYAGPGFKTVIPARATAKLSCRLVAGQDPSKIANAISTFLQERAPEGIELSITVHSKEPAARSSATSPIAEAAAEAYSELFGIPCQRRLCGGSIPIAAQLAEAAGGDLLFVGLGLASDSIHSPNEHFGWDRIERGVELVKAILHKWSRHISLS